ncbi:MAG: type II secretion system inner membrane protein GspF [Bdellovibrionales bacterium]|nr:type II secretion system inner membrane protein GspF [Bdellovibrionales bacterium]
MPSYEYTAISKNGKSLKGTIDADNVRTARQKLRSQNIFPTNVKESNSINQFNSRDITKYFSADKIASKDLSVMTRQLATLLGAGLPLVSALQALSEQTDSLVLKRIIIEVRENVEEGSDLASALSEHPKSFPRLYINMVKAGEASGTLDTVMNNLADYLEAQLELKRKIRSALTYPILMLCFSGLVTMVLFIFVVPKVVEIFEKQGATLPLPTRIMLAISYFLRDYWYLVLILIFGSIFLFRWYYKQEHGKAKIDAIVLKLPILGPLYTKIATSRVSRTLATLLSSGVGLLAGLDISKNIVGNVHVTNAIESAKEGVREGKSLAREFSQSGIFPNMLSHMIAVGEKSGELENMLQKASSAYEADVNATLSGLTSLLEPLMMFVVGGVVLCIVIAVLLPMADLINVIGG